jgi:hypothetical protein
MKVHLVFPPVWLTEIPYLSVPVLRACLNRIAGVQTRSLDLNIAFWSHLRSESSLAELLVWARRKLKGNRAIHSRGDLDAVLRLRAIASDDVDSLVGKIRDGSIPTSVLLSCIKMHFAEDVLGEPADAQSQGWQHDRIFHDPYLNSISLSHFATTSDTLLRSLDIGEGRNPFLRLMPTLYRQVVGGELPDLLGVSVTAVNQVVPALNAEAELEAVLM